MLLSSKHHIDRRRALQLHVKKNMKHVVISAAVDRHLSQSEDVYL